MDKAKWMLVSKAVLLVAVAVGLRAAVVQLHWDIIAITPLISALVGGVIFTLAIVFTGVLSDFKESERIPGELATSIRGFHNDFLLSSPKGEGIEAMNGHVLALLRQVCDDLDNGNKWDADKIGKMLQAWEGDVRLLAGKGAPPPLLARMRGELTNVDRISSRIETIMKTTFIPAAYAISELVVGISLVTLLLTRMEPFAEGLVLFGFAAFILVSLLLLIKDMDNPFEGHAKVDMGLLKRLERQMAT